VSLVVTVAAPLSLDPVAAIHDRAAAAGAAVEVQYLPGLLPVQRLVADHRGEPRTLSPADARRWQAVLARTEVALGIPGDAPEGICLLCGTAPGLRWVQGTAAGTGEQLLAAGLPAEVLSRLTVTSAAGLHAQPLAEFALLGMLAFAKDIDALQQASAARTWRPRWPMRLLGSSHVVVLGLGGIGCRTAQLAHAVGARVTGVRRRVGDPPPGVGAVVPLEALPGVLPEADVLVNTLPGTAATRGLLDSAMLARLPRHAVVVNVGRGAVLDSAALVSALDAGRLRGAVLDVTDVEPLPARSPLWGRPDVLLSPHTAALTTDEDDRILDLFCDNLERFVRGEPLRNVVDPATGY
jgi:phosphoglycerate dehydrogenase-like enzyme